MPSPPATPNQKPKPELPEPTFKYGSATYIVLTYAKMVKKPFSIMSIRKLTGRYKNDYEVKRSLDVLERNGSVVKVGDNKWQVTPVGIQQVYDFARRKPSSHVHGD